ncbi:UBA/THIF-type NAD/FAD binding protein [Nitzschia inconspicua]|uniref:UBA/THIF-type NAD/FAD binding protein n=1 Tax=Nitzschia inconspicua TaxID=303405 RepID=A0A9K3K6Q7_9STRA|nr:UBA/THIF-type NAD/FAD binding protein [Nitzschia inconspicua]KAG7373650.1 UBA/THIF-type NAD/FAD binding protein [Nitzschia inconspicua]
MPLQSINTDQHRPSQSAWFLVGGFLTGAVSMATLGWIQQRIRQHQQQSNHNVSHHSTKKLSSNGQNKRNSACLPTNVPTELRNEQLSRHTLYFGEDGMKSLQNAKVCIVGVGGVGSHAACMLARGGVTHLRLIDFDQVTLSSLNRHACATLQDVGIPKVICLQKLCHQLGVVNVDAIAEMYTATSGPQLLQLPSDQKKWDIVIDCIDDVPTKAALLSYCLKNQIRVLSCMGAGGKSDMTRLHLSDLRTASRDPLASKLRQTLKKVMQQEKQQQQQQHLSSTSNTTTKTKLGKDNVDPSSYLDDMDQLTIIYSSEKTVMKLADLTEEQQEQRDKSQFGAVDNFRIRILPVLGPLPAIMGQSLAAVALCELGQKPIHQPVTGERVGKNVRHKIYQHLTTREQKIRSGDLIIAGGASYTGPIQIDGDDVEYLLGVWRNKCAVTGTRLGTTLSLVRWDTSKPATVDNLVLLASHALQKYDQEGKDSIPLPIQQRIERRLAGCRDLNAEF